MIFAAIFLMSQAVLAVEIMPVKDIKPGMKGYGYTVYQGVMPEKFKFEVLGVDYFYNTAVDSPVVLVKLTSGPKDFPPEKTGVVAGMSGSPMYINGKLVGALAYGFGKLPKDPIAGIQPAENM
ncbi:MAG: SpoIVB peptidase S55 domain-containing protein, partial [Patescibacteria group bacterium]